MTDGLPLYIYTIRPSNEWKSLRNLSSFSAEFYTQTFSEIEFEKIDQWLSMIRARDIVKNPEPSSQKVAFRKIGLISGEEDSSMPTFIKCGVNDFNYMPLAWGGDFTMWEDNMRWYLDRVSKLKK